MEIVNQVLQLVYITPTLYFRAVCGIGSGGMLNTALQSDLQMLSGYSPNRRSYKERATSPPSVLLLIQDVLSQLTYLGLSRVIVCDRGQDEMESDVMIITLGSKNKLMFTMATY